MERRHVLTRPHSRSRRDMPQTTRSPTSFPNSLSTHQAPRKRYHSARHCTRCFEPNPRQGRRARVERREATAAQMAYGVRAQERRLWDATNPYNSITNPPPYSPAVSHLRRNHLTMRSPSLTNSPPTRSTSPTTFWSPPFSLSLKISSGCPAFRSHPSRLGRPPM